MFSFIHPVVTELLSFSFDPTSFSVIFHSFYTKGVMCGQKAICHSIWTNKVSWCGELYYPPGPIKKVSISVILVSQIVKNGYIFHFCPSCHLTGITSTTKINISTHCPHHALQISMKWGVRHVSKYQKNRPESSKSGHFAVTRFAVGGAAVSRWGFERGLKHICKVERFI